MKNMLGTHWELGGNFKNTTGLCYTLYSSPYPCLSHPIQVLIVVSSTPPINMKYWSDSKPVLRIFSQVIHSSKSCTSSKVMHTGQFTAANVAYLKALKDSWWCGYHEGDELATKFWRFPVMGIIIMERFSN